MYQIPPTEPICLTGYGLAAESHWREFLPNLVAQLERKGKLKEALFEAQETTKAEMRSLQEKFLAKGLTHQQAHDQAWEIVRERYIYLPPESDEEEAEN